MFWLCSAGDGRTCCREKYIVYIAYLASFNVLLPIVKLIEFRSSVAQVEQAAKTFSKWMTITMQRKNQEYNLKWLFIAKYVHEQHTKKKNGARVAGMNCFTSKIELIFPDWLSQFQSFLALLLNVCVFSLKPSLQYVGISVERRVL